MPTKKTTTTTTAKTAPTAEDLAQQAKKKADEEQFAARVATDGTANIALVAQYLPNVNGGASPQALADVLHGQVKAIASGDLTQLETMLLAQATALQAMFVDLASRAKGQTNREWLQLHSTLALKCATGSRQAIVALAEMRAPKSVLFAKQANVSNGPQQVNNGMQPAQQAGSAQGGGVVESLPAPEAGTTLYSTQGFFPPGAEIQTAGAPLQQAVSGEVSERSARVREGTGAHAGQNRGLEKRTIGSTR